MSRAVLATLLLIAHAATPATPTLANEQAGQPSIGEWQVTSMTGAIEFTTKGPAPPEGLCEPGTETYSAIAENSFVELALIEHDNLAFFAEKADQELRRVMLDYGDLMPTQRDIVDPAVDAERLFLFSFEFENGYHSNEVLDAEVEFSPNPNEFRFVRMVAAHRDAQDQSNVVGRLATVLADLNAAFGGGEGYVGTWFAANDRPAFLESSFRIFGLAGAMSGGGEVGKSLFLVLGEFDDPRTMSGEWIFNESSQLLDCTSTGSGSGTWKAEAR